MSLAILINALESDLSRSLPRNVRVFAEARARRVELTPFETLADLRPALDLASSLRIDARRALVTALVEEAQRGTSPLWSSLLVVAFAPMMCRLRKRVSAREDEDLDSAVLAAFLAAVRSVRPGSYTSLALRWATEKEVLNGCRAERRLDTRTAFDEDLHSNPTFHDVKADKTIEDVIAVLEKEGAAEILDVLIATRARDESLRAYVTRTCPNPRERGVRYEHLCRARLRFEREIRERMAKRAA